MNRLLLIQGDIWTANLNPNHSHEPGKTCPVLIIQTQYLLDTSHNTTVILPMTTHLIDNAEPLRIRISSSSRLEKDSDILVDQIRAIDNKRFKDGPLLNIGSKKLNDILQALQQLFTIPHNKKSF